MHLRSIARKGLLGDDHRREDGFTLLEVIMAISISAVVFTAVAAVMGQGLKTLAVQKARTQGNEVATAGIEDLQRYSYNSLEVCAAPPNPPDPVPAGLGIPVVSTSTTKCPSAAATTGDDPCTPPTSPLGVPKARYDCTRTNIVFQVRRYVAWADAGRTSKRLAVFVKWTDLVGTHEVSQQSSLRSPVSGDIVGIDPPAFSAAPVVSTRSNTLDDNGRLASGSIILTAQTTGLTAADDRVFVSFQTLEGGDLVTSTLSLDRGAGNQWTGSIPSLPSAATPVFPEGSQYLSFTAVRASDGKTGSVVDSESSTFCRLSCPTGAPTFTLSGGRVSQSVSSVAIDDTGALQESNATVTITATTQNLTNLDTVSFQFVTRTGTVNTAMVPGSPCDTTACTWTATISRASGYAFNPGTQSMYFLAAQTAGATAAARSTDIAFATS